MTLVIEFFGHMDAGDRSLWKADHDTRPLSELGRRQAEALCGAIAASAVDALYSSPALRCVQSIEPLGTRFGLSVKALPDLRETDGWLPPPSWSATSPDMASAIGGAFAAGRAMRALSTIKSDHGTGRVAACTHGDVMPALVGYLAGAYDLKLPAYFTTRGGWYTLRLDSHDVRVEQHDVLAGFPL